MYSYSFSSFLLGGILDDMSDDLVPIEFLKKCLGNLDAEVKMVRQRLDDKRQSGQQWTEEETKFMDDEGNIIDETVLVDDYSDAVNKKDFLRTLALNSNKIKAYRRLLANAYPLPIHPASPAATNPSSSTLVPKSGTTHSSLLNLSAPEEDAAAIDISIDGDHTDAPLGEHHTDDLIGEHGTDASSVKDSPSVLIPSSCPDQVADIPITKVTKLKRSHASPLPFRHGYPYAHVGPPESSILAIPHMLTTLNIALYIDDYNVSYLQ